MKIKFLTLCIITLLPFLTYSQAQKGYTASAGIKLGKFSSGVSGKMFFGTTNANAIEMNVTMKKNFNTVMSTVFYEHQKPFFYSALRVNLDYIWGVGVHAAYYKPGYYKIRNGGKDAYYGEGVSAGIDFKLGLEHIVSFFPVTIAIEACPMIDLINRGPEHIELALSLRYTVGNKSRNSFRRR